jgi:DNA-binding NarL/FixJ family response regulator
MLINREPDLVVCGEITDASAAMAEIAARRADIVILDASPNGLDGIRLLKEVRKTWPELPVLIFSMYEESLFAERALGAGANGYLMKKEATEKILLAIRQILAGEIYLSEGMAMRLFQRFVHGEARGASAQLATLSHREMEVFRLIGSGQANRQISQKLHLSVKTIETYAAHIKAKLSLSNARELAWHAMAWTLDEQPG